MHLVGYLYEDCHDARLLVHKVQSIMMGLCLVMNWKGSDNGLFGNVAREFV